MSQLRNSGIRYPFEFKKSSAKLAIESEQTISKTAQRRYEILLFWEKHGLLATLDAFKVSRRTLYHWQKQFKQGKGNKLALEMKSRAPKKKRKRIWPLEVIHEIKRLRKDHPNLSKEKIYPLLKRFCQQHVHCPSIRTIGRIIQDALNKMRTVAVRLRPNGSQ